MAVMLMNVSWIAGFSVCTTYPARAIHVGKVSHSHYNPILSVCSLEHHIEKVFFIVLKIPSQCISAQVSNLHHAGQLAIHEERGFDDVLYVHP
jgi:hypothetical protein